MVAISPTAFSIFGFDIKWYGIYYSVGFLVCYFLLLKLSKLNDDYDKEKFENLFLYFMIFSVLGGRIFYCIFYNPVYYLSNPLEIFAVWNGGMSIHGAFITGIMTLYFFCKRYGWNLLKILDLFSIPVALGLTFGRLANFVNQELVGIVTNSNIGLVFPLYDNQNRWPYQLFASAKNMFAFQILLYMYYFKKLKPGILSAWFLILYGFGRFFVDFFRVPTVDLGMISLGQLLSIIMGFAGIILFMYSNKQKSENKNVECQNIENQNQSSKKNNNVKPNKKKKKSSKKIKNKK